MVSERILKVGDDNILRHRLEQYFFMLSTLAGRHTGTGPGRHLWNSKLVTQMMQFSPKQKKVIRCFHFLVTS